MSNKLKKITSMQLFLPIFCMILVMAANILYDAANGNFALNFFTISIKNGVLYGRLIDILNRGSEIAILAIGMTLVVSASAGTDISVGSVMSLAASFCCMLLAGYGVSSTATCSSAAGWCTWWYPDGLSLRCLQWFPGSLSECTAYGRNVDSVLCCKSDRSSALQQPDRICT